MRQDVLTIKGANADQVIQEFCYVFQPTAKYVITKGEVHVYVIEQFYFRIGAEVAATVLIDLSVQNILNVHIIIAGGADLMGITLGAHNSMLKKIHKFFAKFGDNKYLKDEV